MIISYEFVLNKPIDLTIGSFFESSLYQNGEYVNRSFGSGNFHINTTLFSHQRLSALGCNCVTQIAFEELPSKVKVQPTSQIQLPTVSNLEILCKTNIFLSKELLCDFISLLIQIDYNKNKITLSDTKKEIVLIDKGRYLINLSNILLTTD